jgi:WD40 repeat protein
VGGCTKEPSLALRVFDRAGSMQRSLSVPRPKQSYNEACAGPLVARAGWIGAVINDKAHLVPQKGGESRGEFEAGVSVQALALSSDGSRFYVGGYGSAVNAFDTQTLKAVRSFGFFSYESEREIQGLALSPDGSTLAVSASVSASKVRLYDVGTGLERLRLEAGVEGAPLTGHSFASQGDVLAFPLRAPALIGRFDWKTGVQRGPHDLGRHDDVVEHVLVAQGGTLVTSSRDGTLRAWRPDGSPVATQRSVGGSASIALGASGTLLATGVASRSVAGSASPLCAVTVHDAATLALRDTIELGDGEDSDCWASDLVTSAGGSVAYAVFDKRLVAFDPATKSALARIPAEGRRGALVALSDGTLALRREGRWEIRDGSSLASRRVLDLPEAPFAAARGAMVGAQRVSDEQIAILDLRTGKTTRTVDAPKGTRFSFYGAVALSPDGQVAYAGTVGDGVSGLVAFSVATGKLLGSLERLHDLGHPQPISLDLSPDGATLIEGNSDGTSLVIDARSFGGVK